MLNNIKCPYCYNSQGLVINIDFKAKMVLGGVCVMRRFKPSLKRKFGHFDSGCGRTFSLALKSKEVANG